MNTRAFITGLSGLELGAEEREFDVVLVAYELYGMNGVEFIGALRARVPTVGIPVVMITGTTHISVRHAAIEAGATDFLNKPVDPIELLLLLRKCCLGRPEAEDSVAKA